MQRLSVLILGTSGSGKSRLAFGQLVPAMLERVPRLLIINDNPEGAELCRASLTVTDDSPSYEWARLLREQERVHVELLANDPTATLEALSAAVLEVGHVVVVIDEAHEFAGAHNAPAGIVRLYKQGRKHGVHIVTITQSVVSTSAGGLSRDAARQSDVWVVFRQHESREVDRVRDEFPELGERVRELAPPDQAGPPEYAVRDRKRGASLIYRRSGAEWLADHAGAGAGA